MAFGEVQCKPVAEEHPLEVLNPLLQESCSRRPKDPIILVQGLFLIEPIEDPWLVVPAKFIPGFEEFTFS